MGGAAVTERGLRRKLRLPRRLRVRAKAKAGERPEAHLSSPTAYRTLTRKVPVSLTALGGALALLGGLGAWVRASRVASEGVQAEEVRVLMGSSEPSGLWIAGLGLVALAGALAWRGGRLLPKLVPVAASAAAIVLVTRELPEIDRTAGAWLTEAREGTLDFVSFHTGFGWGAWLMLVGAVALALGIVAGVLREIDLRRGIPE